MTDIPKATVESITRPSISKPTASFYKRPLPPKCTSFSSQPGKEIFANALLEGNMEAYFPLASQFVTQNEPAYCGLGTLVMILNALEVDPGRRYKGPWRWYEQEMLDCCRSLQSVAETGISLTEFTCIARCNGLNAHVHSAPMGLDKFRQDVKMAARSSDMFMALSYSRASLGQTGSGHFSPVGGYSEAHDSLLLLDVARFKYPSYWTSIQDAYEAMLPLDQVTQLPRGYTLLSPVEPSESIMTSSLTTITLNKSTWKLFQSKIGSSLDSVTGDSIGEFINAVGRVVNSKEIRVVGKRSIASQDSLSALLDEFNGSQFGKLLQVDDPIDGLFLMALFAPNGPFNIRIPQKIKPQLMEEILSTISSSSMSTEMTVLQQQLTALGECCQQESELSCACGKERSCS
ncbi:Glutathione gamma-glutamylcysteinyltransferase [Wallemia ichthyophaga EXF-994]|uniref:glutathione gamma-glutamylcysteinyltransferase n=1 Tax=Wallemia ichthyophaga (strain EXF-994 / CBS 113033) TaxID=1299270 RepID=R9ABD6_WALI9|nr:Glutathione gamma-glutamylcysteinyltransferase [Wallemia ichthyophaga EXF-994]EOQ99533.1 Glutathione gamma-glutamylcysteinyltransferase [Wallemia ichthyophaga EXF-994]